MTTTTLEPEAIEQTEERFMLDTEEKVNWLLRKLANLQTERERIAAQYQTMIQQIDADIASLKFRFENDLKAFTAQRIAETGNRRKSVHLLQGTLAFRTVPASVKVADLTAALDFARVTGLPTVNIVETLDIVAYRKQAEERLQQVGELLPGVELVPERESFCVRFGKEEAR